MSTTEQLVAGMTTWAETLSPEERSLLTQVLARAALQAELEGRDTAADPKASEVRLRLSGAGLPELIGLCVAGAAKAAGKHGITLINSGDLATPGNLGVVKECWYTI